VLVVLVDAVELRRGALSATNAGSAFGGVCPVSFCATALKHPASGSAAAAIHVVLLIEPP
jgi:hypothetical protein